MFRLDVLALAFLLIQSSSCFNLAPNMLNIAAKKPIATSVKILPRQMVASPTMFESVVTKTTKKAGLEGLKSELLELCSETRVGMDTPDGSAERDAILRLVEKIERQNPVKEPVACGAVDGEWTLRWTTSMRLLGAQRPRGFRVDLSRPILQRIDTAQLRAVNVEPVTTLSWLRGGLQYENTVDIDLEVVSGSQVDAILNKFSFGIFSGGDDGGLLSFSAPVRARGYIDTTYVDSARTVGATGALRISRGNDGNVFILTRNGDYYAY